MVLAALMARIEAGDFGPSSPSPFVALRPERAQTAALARSFAEEQGRRHA